MIDLKTPEEIKILKKGGRILAKIMKKIAKRVRPGVATGELEDLAVELIKKAGGRPSFKGYRSRSGEPAFPTALCASINSEIVHAPAYPARILKEGDIIGLDLGMEYPFLPGQSGFYTDMAITAPVGKISAPAAALIKATKKSLSLAIKEARVGKTTNDIGRTVENYILNQRFSVVRDLVGHGVGRSVHEDPQVPNYAVDEKRSVKLREGMVIAIEPMVNIGGPEMESSADGFTFKTLDGSLSAHFEHTVAITAKGPIIITE